MVNIVGLFGTVIVIALIVSLGMMTLSNIEDTQPENSTEYNATAKGITAMKTYSTFLMPITMIVIVIFILGLVAYISKNTSGVM